MTDSKGPHTEKHRAIFQLNRDIAELHSKEKFPGQMQKQWWVSSCKQIGIKFLSKQGNCLLYNILRMKMFHQVLFLFELICYEHNRMLMLSISFQI